MKLDFDIAVIGLGPAGSIFASLASKHFSVAAIDLKDDFYNGFSKPCGGLLAPDAQKALAKFDITLPKDILVNPQIFSVKTIDLDHNNTRYYQRFYVNIDRHKFDLWLESFVLNKATVFNGCRCSKIEEYDSFYKIFFYKNGEEHSITSKYLVGADGANSIVRTKFFKGKKIKSYIAIQQWFKAKDENPFYSCIFDSKNTDCYSQSVHKDGYLIFGGAFPYKDSRARFENQKQKLKAYGFKFDNPVKTEACLVLRPASMSSFCLSKNNVFLIGEAAGFISPSSLEGISSAIISGYLLSKALLKNNPNKSYQKSTFTLRLKLFCKNLKNPFMYNPFIRNLVMKSDLKAIKLIEK